MAKKYLVYDSDKTQWGRYVKSVATETVGAAAGASAFREYERERLALTRYYDKTYGHGNYDYNRVKFEAANIVLYGSEMQTEQIRQASLGITDPAQLATIATDVRLSGLRRSAQETGARLDVAQAIGINGDVINLRNASLEDILQLYRDKHIDLKELNLLIDDYKTFALFYYER